jgi:benzoyl-CoA reductase/2-hydroxyglutaryl-CoA dehydratase subunit BcrC/BadD/HgdB
MGPTSTANIWYAKECAENGYDGLVHVKSAGCTPEIDIMPVLQRIGADFKIPILYLIYDSQDGDAGLQTRIEAFYDMIEMRKKVIH